MEAKDLIAATFSVVTAFVTLFNWRGARFRGKLKDDLEIIKRYREELGAVGHAPEQVMNDEHYLMLQRKIERKIMRAYGTHRTDWSDFWKAMSLIAAAAFLWTYSGFNNSPWAKPVGVTCVVVAAYFVFEAIWGHLRGSCGLLCVRSHKDAWSTER